MSGEVTRPLRRAADRRRVIKAPQGVDDPQPRVSPIGKKIRDYLQGNVIDRLLHLEERVARLERRYVYRGVDWDEVQLVSPEGVARKFGVSRSDVMHWVATAQIPSIVIGGLVRIPKFWVVDRMCIPVEQYGNLREEWFGVAKTRLRLPRDDPRRRDRVDPT